MIKLLLAFLLLSFHARAKVDQPKLSDNEFVMPGEFCNADSNDKQKVLLDQYPHDAGSSICMHCIWAYAKWCMWARLPEQAANQQWQAERDKLIQSRKQRKTILK